MGEEAFIVLAPVSELGCSKWNVSESNMYQIWTEKLVVPDNETRHVSHVPRGGASPQSWGVKLKKKKFWEGQN
jgi:hypothetical protein